jgi:hypothetical protein
MASINPSITERKRRTRRPTARPPDGNFSIKEWCAHRRISEGTYYKLKRLNRAPKTIPVGSRQLITPEADQAWEQSQLEDPA